MVRLLAAAPAAAAGFLVSRDGRSRFAIRSHRVTAEVTDGLARTTVRQVFVSEDPGLSEAVYVFPLPEGASLVGVSMETAGQRLAGVLAERKRARRTYDDIVRSRRDPGLVEQVGRNAFRMSVFPIEAGTPVVVELTWVEWLPLTGGAYRYVYPLATDGEAASTEEDFTISVRMRSAAPLVDVTGSKDLEIVRVGPGEVLSTMERIGAKLDEDVVVTGRVKTGEPSLALTTWRGEQGDGIFLAVVTPPELSEDRLVPRDVLLVLDTSGSMQGERIEQAKAAALRLLDHLRAADRVNVIRFASEAEAFADAPVAVTEESRGKLRASVEGFRALGGTNIGAALAAAGATPAAEGRVRTVALLTDGEPTIGETDAAALVRRAREIGDAGLRIHAFGVGAGIDAGLLRGIASAGRGRAELFRPGGEIESRLTSFLVRTSSPVLADVRIEVDGVPIHDVYPRPLPDACLGEQVVIVGRYRDGGPAKVRISALLGGRRVSLAADADFRTEAGGEEAARWLFARQKLDWLVEQVRLRQGLTDEAYFAALDRGAYSTGDEIVREAVVTSLELGVPCPYTSWLVLLPQDRELLGRRKAAPPDDPVVRDAKVRDHNETDDDLPFEESLGRKDYLNDAPLEGPSWDSVPGGGAGGSLGGRGGHRDLRAGGEGRTPDQGVDLGLAWLAAHQHEDGSWSPDGDRVSDTGLALLAFLGAGETHRHGSHKEIVRNGLRYLKQVQRPDGGFGSGDDDAWRKSHAIAALAMTEAYALTASPLFKQSSQSAMDLLQKLPLDDAELIPWAAAAAKSAKAAGLRLDYEGLAKLSDRVPDSAAILIRVFAGVNPRKDEKIVAAAERLRKTPPEWGVTDSDTLYFGTLSMFQFGGEPWTEWNRALKPALLDHQITEGPDRGAWPPAGIATTAKLTMCLEVYYRYARVFGAR